MKAIPHRSLSFTEKRANSKSFHLKLTPLDFDNFIPWFCLQFQSPINVNIKRIKRDDMKRTSSAKSKSKELKAELEHLDTVENTKGSLSSTLVPVTKTENAISLTAYYNSKEELVEIAFINSPFEINRKIMQAINLCLPFHKSLFRFRIKRCLTQTVLQEMSKLLPHSNITDITLDDNFLPEGNYYLLLSESNKIKNLSLRRCYINDESCKLIVSKMHFGCPAFSTLLTLDLASNCITDLGAEYIGSMLRQNRTLVYLNISDNKISDNGAQFILNPLLKFSLNEEEKLTRNYRQLEYFTKRLEVNKKCKDEIVARLKYEENKENQRKLGGLKRERGIEKRKTVTGFDDLTIAEQAEQMTTAIIGEFKDVFGDRHLIRKNGQVYDTGNLRLTYLNFAYNNLGYSSVRKIYDVLKYQSEVNKPANFKGLLRIILEGNSIPRTCKELEGIEFFLETVITENVPLEVNKYKSSLKSRMKSHHKNLQQ